jgi:hypothetical protein
VLFELLEAPGIKGEISRKCSDGSSPLHIAVVKERIHNVLVLINAGADVDAQNQDGNTPLHFCARFRNLEIPRCLIAAGAKIRIMNANRQTASFAASHYRNSHMLEFLSSVKSTDASRHALEAMIRKYLPSLLPQPELKTEEEESSEEDDEELDPEVLAQVISAVRDLDIRLAKFEGRSETKSETVTGLNGLDAKLRDLNDRIDVLDAKSGSGLHHAIYDDLKTCGGMCCLCGSAAESFCQDCQRMFCESCLGGEGHIAFHVNLYG